MYVMAGALLCTPMHPKQTLAGDDKCLIVQRNAEFAFSVNFICQCCKQGNNNIQAGRNSHKSTCNNDNPKTNTDFHTFLSSLFLIYITESPLCEPSVVHIRRYENAIDCRLCQQTYCHE